VIANPDRGLCKKRHFFSLYSAPRSCNCTPGYQGLRCENNVDDCAGHKCSNNATCVDLVEAYRCDCPAGFTGQYCEAKIPFCTKEHNPCRNAGRCVNHQSHYSCECPSGFAGANCTDNLDDCDNNLCQVRKLQPRLCSFL
jgi:hypothetical protein